MPIVSPIAYYHSLNKNIKIIVNYILGPLVFLFLSFAIYHQLAQQHHWKDSLLRIQTAITGPQRWKIGLVVLGMLANWSLEARKWQLLNLRLQRVNFAVAIRAVFTGLTIASFTPNRMGEYLGRMLYIDPDKRVRSIALTLVGSVAQLLVTGGCGLFGLFYLRHFIRVNQLTHHTVLDSTLQILLGLVVFGMVLLWLLYFRLHWLVRMVQKLDTRKRIDAFVKVLSDVPPGRLFSILCLSFGRYSVFMIQYWLLFSVFEVELTPMQLFGGISVMFLIMAVVPTLTFLTDLGLRWESGLQIMQLFSANLVGIFAASLGIWIINLIIPALVGSLLILGIKIFRIQ